VAFAGLLTRPELCETKTETETKKRYEAETKNYETETSPAKLIACESNTNWYD